MKHLYQFSKRMLRSIFFCLTFICSGHVYAVAPTSPSSNFSASSIEGNMMQLNFTAGDGNQRIIIASEKPVTAVPKDGVDYLAANYGFGNEIAPGQFVVYKGGGSGTWLYGLNHSTKYYFRIFEFNGRDFNTVYLTSAFLEGNASTLIAPTSQARDFTFTNVTGNSMTVNWTNGNGTGRILVARANKAVEVEPEDLKSYGAWSAAFGYSGLNIIGNSEHKVLFGGSGNSVNITNLDPAITYHFAVFEYNGSSGTVYLRPGTKGSQMTSFYPTKAASSMTFEHVDGNLIQSSFTAGDGQRRLVIAKKGSAVTSVPVDGSSYTANPTFGSGQELNSGEFVVSNDASAGFQLFGLEPSTTYYFAVFEYNGTEENTFYLKDSYLQGSQATISAPTSQAKDFTFTNVTGHSMTVNWTNGDGIGRILVGRANKAVEVEPEDLVSYVARSGALGYSGSNIIGNSEHVVLFGGSGNSVNITNLDPAKTYHFAVFEYNEYSGFEDHGNSGKVYLRPGAKGSQLTSSAPTKAASNMLFQNVNANSLYGSFTIGDGQRRIVIAKKGSAVTSVPEDGIFYTANHTFGSGQELNSGEFVVYNDASEGFWLSGLELSTSYHFAVFEYNGTGENTFYLKDSYLQVSQATISAPTNQAKDFTFTNVTGKSMTVNWTNGNGTGRILVARANKAVEVEPEDLTSHSAWSAALGYPGSNIIGNSEHVVLYGGSGNSVNITNLEPAITYHFAVFEYNGTSERMYLRPGSKGSQMTGSYPTKAATSLTFQHIDGTHLRPSFTAGDGQRRLVIAKKGSAVTSVPVDGSSYTANQTFGSGQELNSGEFVVYNGVLTGVYLYGMEPSATYHFAVFEYNGTGTNTFYLKDPLRGSQTTLSKPTVQSSNAITSIRSNTHLNISWTNGNGSSRILIARKDGPVNVEPEDLKIYQSAINGFGSSLYEVGSSENFILYRGTGNNVDIIGLQPGTNYHFALFEYNGNNAPLYMRPGYAFSMDTFGERPKVQVSGAQFSNVDFSSFDVSFTKGNGSRRIVLVREGSAISGGPVDFINYTANNTFGQGQEIRSGTFVVYNGFGENFKLEGLQADKIYHLAFYEYSLSENGALYMEPAYTSTQATTGEPTVIPTNFKVSAECGEELDLSWTAGNGVGRLVVLSENDLTTAPANFTNYTANARFKSGTAIGNGYVVYKGSGTTVTATGLGSKNYVVNIFEYNTSDASPYFNPTPLQGNIADKTAPQIEAITTQIVAAGANCNAILPDYRNLAVVSDNCDPNPVITQNHAVGTVITGTTMISMTATDASGNKTTTTFNVVVEDLTPPTITAPADISKVLTPGASMATGVNLGSPITADNCGIKATTNNAPASFPIGETNVIWTVEDISGNKATATQKVIITAVDQDCASAYINEILHINPVRINSPYKLIGIVFGNVKAAEWNWGDGKVTKMKAPFSSWEASHIYTEIGTYMITLTIIDDCGAEHSMTTGPIQVSDPNSGSVIGAGWINSPKGAFINDPEDQGQVHFGFIARYRRNSPKVDGTAMMFQLKKANLAFIGTSITDMSLLVTGTKAVFSGEGMLNRQPGYAFMISVIDGDINYRRSPDTFRIKIWRKSDGLVIYDNQRGAGDDADAIRSIAAGQIVIIQQNQMGRRADGSFSASSEALNVPWNTSFDKLLSTYKNELTVASDVEWDLTGYDPLTAGYYEVTGKGKDQDIAIHILVENKAKATGIELSQTLVNTSLKMGEEVAKIQTIDAVDDQHTYILDSEYGNSKLFTIQGNRLIWIGDKKPESMELRIISVDRAGQEIASNIMLSRENTKLQDLKIPNTFTPNSDGANDTWGIPEGEALGTAYTISVYDRGGNLLFSTQDSKVRWDGTHNGKLVSVGTYFYVIEDLDSKASRRGVLNLLKR